MGGLRQALLGSIVQSRDVVDIASPLCPLGGSAATADRRRSSKQPFALGCCASFVVGASNLRHGGWASGGTQTGDVG